MSEELQATKFPRNITIASDDCGGWNWKVIWRKGSEEYGSEDSFEEAHATVNARIKYGEQPL